MRLHFFTMARMDVLAMGSVEMLTRPCVDCGQWTGRFCDYCRAADRIPTEEWAPNQLTPLCSACDWKHERCHFCRGQKWARPFTWGVPPRREEEEQVELTPNALEALGLGAPTAPAVERESFDGDTLTWHRGKTSAASSLMRSLHAQCPYLAHM